MLTISILEGSQFIQPILETNILQQLVSCLQLSLSFKSALAIAKCLVAIAHHFPTKLAEILYTKPHIQCFNLILERARDNVASQQACDSILTLLCKTLASETHKRALVDSGLLTTLSTRLASFVAADGLVPPNFHTIEDDSLIHEGVPEPAPSSAHLSPVLESLSLLIERSKARANIFLTNPVIKTVFPDLNDDFSPSDLRRAPWGTSYFSGAAIPRSPVNTPFDSLLPFVPLPEKTSSIGQAGFPPLGSVQPMPKRRTSFLPTSATEMPQLGLGRRVTDEEEESSVISWLLYSIRESRGKRRLLAAKLLVNLYHLGFVKRYRASTLAPLLVPLLTRMLEADQLRLDDIHQPIGSCLCSGVHFTKAVPAVLAMLIMDDPEMQRVAVEGKAIVNLATGLKLTFENPTTYKVAPWQPQKTADSSLGLQACSANTEMNPFPSAAMRQEMEFRQGCLQALAAIAPFNDEYRKEICDQGVLAHIMSALEPYHVQVGPNKEVELTGNAPAVILAACGAVRVLTRSVQALRTKLVEAEVARPIINLMSSSDPEIRIAATMVLANLAIDFSPMKDGVSESTVVKKLCEQAHSANARLRLESLWALKQLVLNASKKLKQEVVDELGSSWIKLLIKTDPIDIPNGEVIGLVEREYPPLNIYCPSLPAQTNPSDVIMGDDVEAEPTRRDSPSDPNSDFSARFDTRHTTEDDVEIQAQLLDLLRNLFCGDNASDLVKYVFDEMGQEDFFRILLERLRSRTLVGPTRKDNFTTPAPSVIVVKVLYILVHIAACEPKWRNVIASNYILMKQVLAYTSHADREIRAKTCWIAINLTYEDDSSDRLACRQRALELQKVGFVASLRKLENDPDLNVRERAKSAIHLMTKLIAS